MLIFMSLAISIVAQDKSYPEGIRALTHVQRNVGQAESVLDRIIAGKGSADDKALQHANDDLARAETMMDGLIASRFVIRGDDPAGRQLVDDIRAALNRVAVKSASLIGSDPAVNAQINAITVHVNSLKAKLIQVSP